MPDLTVLGGSASTTIFDLSRVDLIYRIVTDIKNAQSQQATLSSLASLSSQLGTIRGELSSLISGQTTIESQITTLTNSVATLTVFTNNVTATLEAILAALAALATKQQVSDGLATIIQELSNIGLGPATIGLDVFHTVTIPQPIPDDPGP